MTAVNYEEKLMNAQTCENTLLKGCNGYIKELSNY